MNKDFYKTFFYAGIPFGIIMGLFFGDIILGIISGTFIWFTT